jgi:hypothetical protein
MAEPSAGRLVKTCNCGAVRMERMGVGQFSLKQADHDALTHDCHLDCSRVTTFPAPELATCLFADPIADIAVLGAPDSQDLPEEADEYESLLEKVPVVLSISEAPRLGRGWLLSLDRKWFDCKVHHVGGPLWVTAAHHGIRGGMSGSPILSDDGSAVGIVVAGGGTELDDDEDAPTEGGPDPWLVGNLPGWLLREIGSRG